MGLQKREHPHTRILFVICNGGRWFMNLGIYVYFDIWWGRREGLKIKWRYPYPSGIQCPVLNILKFNDWCCVCCLHSFFGPPQITTALQILTYFIPEPRITLLRYSLINLVCRLMQMVWPRFDICLSGNNVLKGVFMHLSLPCTDQS